MRILVIAFLLLSSYGFSQQRIVVKGFVVVDGVPYGNVNVINESSSDKFDVNSGVTDKFGAFLIKVREGDILLFSSIDLEVLRLSVKAEDILMSEVKVQMNKRAYQLKEVTIDKSSEINAVSLGIIPKAIKRKTQVERQLYTAGDFKPIHLLGLLAGSMEVDPILNAINGRTKKLKNLILIESKETNIKFFNDNHREYILRNLKIPEEELSKFCYFLVDQKEVQEIINSKDDLKIKFFLCDQLVNYKSVYSKEIK
ncbi:hypothetical protein [Flavobacterium sp. ABG]|uniref:hypothetical protein n=1 Tax=Flavobacterium sp. ABG TaxID=1423322 RepID=UPI00069A24F8|nr:hypothetical protein [Flavobacterium sp. ABG]